ncbi:CoB--CoM heterodisulfide reductase iron-sulfur subunit A 1 (fragment) [Desulfamplus magnetovallimortis]|uniref:CoB--CoM heterodisulfide reductase iron-sulfur subunit A 1 n=1 Tax=Desulfamplus magnetovallimortis TaxID=1246637 RepID=A0A1W1HD19_9BACT
MLIFNVGALANQLGVHRNTVTNWIKSGKLAAETTAAKKYAIEKDIFRRFCIGEHIPDEIVEKILTGAFEKPTAPKPRNLHNIPQREPIMRKKNLGSVMVVGGGIAGIQSTLDLADSGYYVYLIEKSPGIGGAMAQLDKTFPTNDCAM